ncbi:MAG: helix-turn-helix transcriptional regulator [Anaerolineae bacterium]|nr:helix-turn-helix transcriptional regulator [Anaerolineae bacterium]
MNQNVPFGEWLRQRRTVMGYTQAELAEQVGVATVTIRKLESRERRPSPALAKLLAVALHIPQRDHAAFTHYARSDNWRSSFPLPAWEPEQPVWRSSQLPAAGPPPVSDDEPGVVLHYQLYRPRPFSYERVVGGHIAVVEARGQVRGDVEGMLTVRITQWMPSKPEAFDYRMAHPMSIGARFTVESGERVCEGAYAGTATPILDAGGNGELRIQAVGHVYHVTPAFVDLFLNHVFVEDAVKMVEGEGTGATGTMSLKPPG